MYLSLSLSVSLYLSLSLSFFWLGHVSLSPWSNVSKVTSLKDRSLKVLSKCICLCHCLCLCLCICLCHCLFFGQVMSPHHPDQMSQGWQVSGVTLVLCFQKVAQWVSEWVSDKVTYWAVGWTAKKQEIRQHTNSVDIMQGLKKEVNFGESNIHKGRSMHGESPCHPKRELEGK